MIRAIDIETGEVKDIDHDHDESDYVKEVKNLKDFKMFLLMMKTGRDFRRLSILLDQAEELGIGKIVHHKEQIDINSASISIYGNKYRADPNLSEFNIIHLIDLYDKYQTEYYCLYFNLEKQKLPDMVRNLKISTDGSGLDSIRIKALGLSSTIMPYHDHKISSKDSIVFNQNYWHNSNGVFKNILINSKNLIFPFKLTIEYDYICYCKSIEEPIIDTITRKNKITKRSTYWINTRINGDTAWKSEMFRFSKKTDALTDDEIVFTDDDSDHDDL